MSELNNIDGMNNMENKVDLSDRNNKNNKSKKEILSNVKYDFLKEINNYRKEFKPSKEISGFASSAIVGEKNYPNVKIHNISNEDIDSHYFNSSNLIKKDYNDLFKSKAKNILGSSSNIYIKKTNDRINQNIIDIYKSKNKIEFSSVFEKEIKFDKIVIDKINGISGSKNEIIELNLDENSRTSKQIEKYIQNDIKSKEAIINLYEKNICEHQIINLLSLGSFGIETNKKLVPTKRAISAYDSIIENYLFKKIKEYKLIETYQVYFISDKGNDFLIILLPHELSGECFEFMQNENWLASDYFDYNNKLKYLEPKISVAYYSNKLAIFEKLHEMKKQAAFISLRIINNYEIPLGVIFVRELVRESMKKTIFKTNDRKELEKFIKIYYTKFYTFFLNSKVLSEIKIQKKLNIYFD